MIRTPNCHPLIIGPDKALLKSSTPPGRHALPTSSDARKFDWRWICFDKCHGRIICFLLSEHDQNQIHALSLIGRIDILKLGEKGAIPQRDNETYAIAPHIPCGFVTPELLRRIADTAEKFNAQAIKITGATRIAIVGLKEEDIDSAWDALKLDKGAAVGLCVRSIRTCPGNTYCKLGKQDAINLGMRLDQKYHGKQLPGKFKMAVSGCHLSCSESWVRDIGLIGHKEGWKVVIGGNVGANPRIAQECASGLDDHEVLSAIERVIGYYQENAKKGERLGKMIDRVGIEVFQQAVGNTAKSPSNRI